MAPVTDPHADPECLRLLHLLFQRLGLGETSDVNRGQLASGTLTALLLARRFLVSWPGSFHGEFGSRFQAQAGVVMQAAGTFAGDERETLKPGQKAAVLRRAVA